MALKLSPIAQETSSYCGPAVIQALLDHAGIKVSQNQVVIAARAKSRVMTHGIRPEQLAKATPKLAPSLVCYLKQNATSSDLNTLIHTHRCPIAVNWQGLFYSSVAEEKKHAKPGVDRGHYSLVTDIKPAANQITIQDPYPEFAPKPRKFSLRWFVTRRWWDVIYPEDKATGKKIPHYTKHLAFIVVPKSATFPKDLGFSLVHNFSYLNHK